MTKREKAIREMIDRALPGGASPDVIEFLTGGMIYKDEPYTFIQRTAAALSDERRALDNRLDELRRYEVEADKIFADARNWLARSHAATSDDRLMGEYLLRELAYKRRMADLQADRQAIFARLAEVDQAKPAVDLILRLAHVRSGQLEPDGRLAAEFGLTFEELVTPAEKGRIERRRKEEKERQEEEARRIEAEREDRARIHAQFEKQKAQEAARDSAEVELVETMTIPQMIRLLFGEHEPPKELRLMLYGQFNETVQRRALQDLADRQRWTSYTPGKVRAAQRLYEAVAGAKYGRELVI